VGRERTISREECPATSAGYSPCLREVPGPDDGRRPLPSPDTVACQERVARHLAFCPTPAPATIRFGVALGLEISAAALSNWESGRRSVPSAVLLQAIEVSGGSADALLARARDRAAAGTSAGAAADEIDLAAPAGQVTEQGREILALAKTIAWMRRRLEDQGILVAETEEEGTGRRADAM
jgi:transcriptional regulator with XRE-family HTH domain